MPRRTSSFLGKILPKLGRLDDAALKSVVERLAREKSFLETLFHTIEDGVVVLNEQARIVFFNEAAGRMLGLESNEAGGSPIQQHLPGLDWVRLLKMDRDGGNQIQRHELEVSIPRPRFLSLVITSLDGGAVGESGLVLFLHDVTEARRQNERAMEAERNEALTLLAASVAHEIGNPLNALSIHLQLMERELRKLKSLTAEGVMDARAPDKLSQYVEVAKGEITRLDYIITQFLQAIRPSKPKLEPASLNDVVRSAVELLTPEIDNRGIELRQKLLTSLPVVHIDSSQMKQVLVNLMKNAIQAMTRGGILTLRTSESSEGVVLSVEDTGGGIPPETLSRIFEPFYTTKKRGSGLGLMIVQRIVTEHGGRVGVESHVGKGTEFRIWLPLEAKTPRLLAEP